MKPRLSRSLRRIIAGVVVCSQLAQADELDWVGTTEDPAWNTESENWAETGTTTPTVTFTEGDDVTFTAAPEADVSTTVSVEEDVTAGRVTVDGDYTFEAEGDAVITGDIQGAGSITKTGAGTLTLEATADNADSALGLTVEEGGLTLDGTNAYGTADIAEGAVLTVPETGDITFNDAVNGSTLVAEGAATLMADSAITTLDAPGTLTVGADGVEPTLTITDAATIGTLNNFGTIAAQGGLTLQNPVAQGGTVETPSLTLESAGNTFTSVTTDLISTPQLSADAPLLTTDTIAAQTAGQPINVQIDQVNRGAEGFTIVDVTTDAASDTTYAIDPDTADMFLQAGLEINPVTGDNGSYAINFNRVPSDYYRNMARTTTAQAGARLIEGAFLDVAPQWNREDYEDLSRIMDGLDALIADGSPAAAAEYDRVLAGVAGATVSCLGVAWRSQMERQLQTIRDRASVMNRGIPCYPEDPKAEAVRVPHLYVWANADADYRNQRSDAWMPGFKMHSIGGTAGVAGRIGDQWVLGGAFTGMSGRISSHSFGDTATGDLDSYYASLFTRFDHDCWSHTLTGVVGWANVDFHRYVNYGPGAYYTYGKPDGMGYGVMYEVTRSFRMNADDQASAWWQPVFNVSYLHSCIDSFTESGSDAALRVGDQKYDNVIFGLGARMQTIFGRSCLNRDCVFNLRVLGKAITGDRNGRADVSFIGMGPGVQVGSSKRSVFGVEVGGGVAIPLGPRCGSIFAECTAEFSENCDSVNGAVGYRFSF